MLFFDIIGCGLAIQASLIAFALHDNSSTRVLMLQTQANLGATRPRVGIANLGLDAPSWQFFYE